VTFFEITTAMAFDYFARKDVQVAVVETGMGGRLDATNVVTPLLSVITPISIEHTMHLGPDLASIAGEKAGIIKEGRPVLGAGMPEEALEVIARTAKEKGARLTMAADAVTVRRVSQDLSGQKLKVESAENSYGTLTIPLLGTHQLENCAVAVAALEAFESLASVRIPPEIVKDGLARTRWPGRCQVIARDPAIIVDGAHNPGAGKVLAATLKELFRKQPVGLILGMCADKDAREFIRQLAGVAKRCWMVPIRSERSVAAADLATLAAAARLEAAAATLPQALDQAADWARREGGALCVTGSLFLAGEILELKGIPV
jgi:dihydrofolate synthase/folylpolyglutamate synthase